MLMQTIIVKVNIVLNLGYLKQKCSCEFKSSNNKKSEIIFKQLSIK